MSNLGPNGPHAQQGAGAGSGAMGPSTRYNPNRMSRGESGRGLLAASSSEESHGRYSVGLPFTWLGHPLEIKRDVFAFSHFSIPSPPTLRALGVRPHSLPLLYLASRASIVPVCCIPRSLPKVIGHAVFLSFLLTSFGYRPPSLLPSTLLPLLPLLPAYLHSVSTSIGVDAFAWYTITRVATSYAP